MCSRVIYTLSTSSDGVNGITLLDNQLFVLRQRDDDQLEAYDAPAASGVIGSDPTRRLAIDGLGGGFGYNDMTSCGHMRRLYVSDYDNKCVHCLEVTAGGSSTKFRLQRGPKWSIDDGPACLSLNEAAQQQRRSLIVSCPDTRRIKELDAVGGQLLRDVVLQPDLESLWHAVKMTSGAGQFVISHGDDGVFVVDASSGLVVRSYAANNLQAPRNDVSKTSLNGPYHVAVDKDGSVLVADCFNNRVVKLSSALEFVGDVVDSSQQLQGPLRLLLDVARRRLFVGQDCGKITVVQLL